jgi:hypothetical protein
MVLGRIQVRVLREIGITLTDFCSTTQALNEINKTKRLLFLHLFAAETDGIL